MSYLDIKIKIFSEAAELFEKITTDFKLLGHERIFLSMRLQLLAALLGDMNAKVSKHVLAPFESVFKNAGLKIDNYVGKTVGEVLSQITHDDPEIDAVFKAIISYIALYNAATRVERIIPMDLS